MENVKTKKRLHIFMIKKEKVYINKPNQLIKNKKVN